MGSPRRSLNTAFICALWILHLIHCQVPVPPPPVSPTDNQAMLDAASSLVPKPPDWGTLDPVNGACGWSGVTCSLVGSFVRVIGLSVSTRGAIPSAIANLDELLTLVLTAPDTNTSLSLPPSLLTMTQLQVLTISRYQGTIPNGIGQLGNLQEFSWVADQLSGTIPASLGQLVNLKRLGLQGLQLSGAIPSLANAGLKSLHLKGALTGTIPSSLFTLGALESLYLNSYQLSGNIHDIGGLRQLQRIEIPFGTINGTIPESIGLLTNLRVFKFRSHKLSGTIPASIGNLIHMQWFDVVNNQLSGTIPASIGNWINATYVDLGNNQLQGEIPLGLVLLPKLGFLRLVYNNLSGNFSALSRPGLGTCSLDSNTCVFCPSQCSCTNQVCDPCNRNVPANLQRRASIFAAAAYDRSLLDPISDEVSVIEDGNNYMILKDECLSIIALSIRGTSFATAEDALADLMTDLSISGSPIGNGIFIHSGFLRRARQLQPAVERAAIYANDLPNSFFYIVGHSLGGAVSTVLAHLYQDRFIGTSINAFAFGMPPAISGSVPPSGPASSTIGVINRYDVVPRLTVQSVLQVVDDCKIGKIAKFLAKPSPGVKFIFWAARKFLDVTMADINYKHVGLILYYNELSSLVALEDPTQFDKIVISSAMISDHYTTSYLAAMQDVPHADAPGNIIAFTCPPSFSVLTELVFDISEFVSNWFKRASTQAGGSTKLSPWFRNGMAIQRDDTIVFVDSLSDIDSNRAVTQAAVLGTNLDAQLHCILWSNMTLTVFDSMSYQALAEIDVSSLISATNTTFLHPFLANNASRDGFIVVAADFSRGYLHNIELLGDQHSTSSAPMGANAWINSAVFLPSSGSYPTLLASSGSNVLISRHSRVEAAAPIQITLDEVTSISSVAVATLDTPRTLVLVLDNSLGQVFAYDSEWNGDVLTGLRYASRMDVSLPTTPVSMVSNQAGTVLFFVLDNHSQVAFSANNMTLAMVLENNRAVRGLEPPGASPTSQSPSNIEPISAPLSSTTPTSNQPNPKVSAGVNLVPGFVAAAVFVCAC